MSTEQGVQGQDPEWVEEQDEQEFDPEEIEEEGAYSELDAQTEVTSVSRPEDRQGSESESEDDEDLPAG